MQHSSTSTEYWGTCNIYVHQIINRAFASGWGHKMGRVRGSAAAVSWILVAHTSLLSSHLVIPRWVEATCWLSSQLSLINSSVVTLVEVVVVVSQSLFKSNLATFQIKFCPDRSLRT